MFFIKMSPSILTVLISTIIWQTQLLKEKYENHPEVLRANIELKRVQDELDRYRNFCEGERDVLMEEIKDIRGQLQCYMSFSMSTQKPNPLLQLANSVDPNSTPLSPISELAEENADEKLKPERCHWAEAESKWISISEELRCELEASCSLAEKWKRELDSEKKCTEELKEALHTAMQGHAHILEQYAELQEKHIALLGRHRRISDGIEDVKRAAANAGVKGTESKFIDALATEISVLRAEREKERRYWRDENKGLQAQLRDTAEAVQAAGEVLVRLKEAEESATIAKVNLQLRKYLLQSIWLPQCKLYKCTCIIYSNLFTSQTKCIQCTHKLIQSRSRVIVELGWFGLSQA